MTNVADSTRDVQEVSEEELKKFLDLYKKAQDLRSEESTQGRLKNLKESLKGTDLSSELSDRIDSKHQEVLVNYNTTKSELEGYLKQFYVLLKLRLEVGKTAECFYIQVDDINPIGRLLLSRVFGEHKNKDILDMPLNGGLPHIGDYYFRFSEEKKVHLMVEADREDDRYSLKKYDLSILLNKIKEQDKEGIVKIKILDMNYTTGS
ncbi:hypothetical protein HYU07_06680 [Candidatus Woesearchaeota archaeon]|nr:hypothetical protein [Candidatus Woesearchaeota archaeon]